VVEVEVFIEPLNTKIVLAAVFKSDINGSQVLASAHGADP